ncbi:MAG: tRNA (5-methylaminomethyl-2-thiouridine)(34)-methyltransferase MnmD [Bacteroidales bacterium]|nr:tRNA (5-methylaminomethyl-2-thiouridine)(34)-methyltransferase MnmD [Bacteroidales bacterium]MCF8326832.1 tRNA (5-methylaminomethyl-2-thiouridine)(34)-methyltransferase MnmD [Bacteroidales bacterium]
MQRNIIKTEDGSHTLYVDELNEHYHSTHGAIKESEHVFIQHGFHNAGKWLNPLNILEIGFGSGLNALLTFRENQKENRKINYIAVEPYPLSKDETNTLNYPKLVSFDNADKIYSSLHKPSESPFFIGDNFILLPLHQKIQDINLKEESINVIYFDAFSPSVSPEMWEGKIFKKLYDALEWQGVLVTYSASGQVKRTLKEAGFSLEHPEGPQGKREITVAKKQKSWSEILS